METAYTPFPSLGGFLSLIAQAHERVCWRAGLVTGSLACFCEVV
jgi:hypothetical protein